MKNRVFSGILFVVFGALIVIALQFIFPVCTKAVETVSGSTVPMKCYWTARAEIGVGLVILCGGLLILISKSLQIRLGISMMMGLIGVFAAALPTGLLIGVCNMPMMPCRMGTLPALEILSLFTIITALINVIYLFKLRNQ